MLNTKSSFYYGHIIDTSNNFLDFDEGAGVLTTSLNAGSYSLTEFATEIERAMNSEGSQEYIVAIDRVTRKLTISSVSNFDLLGATGPTAGTSAFPLMGFSLTDKVGLNSYEGDSGSGSEFRPQFFLQNFIDFEDFQEASSSSVSQSAEGLVQVASFGTIKFMECNIIYINDQSQDPNGFIDENFNAVSEARTFLETVTRKGNIEFIPDRDSPSGFVTCLLESTQGNKQGTGFKLFEMGGKKLFNYYETKKLKFRKVG